MGIKGLFQFLSQYEIRISIVQALHNKSVGIDMFWFLHQSKGNYELVQQYLRPIINHAKVVHCVWDGVPSLKTKEMREQREQKRQEIMQTIAHLDTFIMNQMEQLSEEDQYTLYQYVEQLRRQVWKPTPEYINTVKEWLKEEGCYQYQAVEEADTLLMDLEKEHIVELVISNDSDLLALGSACLLRIYDWEEGGLFDKKRICSKLGLSLCQWNDFMSLCRSMKNPDIHIAYSLIRVYRNLETALQKQNQLSTDIINNISII